MGAAHRYHAEALKIYIQFSHLLGQAMDLGNLGNVALVQGDHKAALRYLEESLEIYTQLDHPLGQVKNWVSLGYLYLELEEFDTAREYYERSVEVYHTIGLDVPWPVRASLEALDGN